MTTLAEVQADVTQRLADGDTMLDRLAQRLGGLASASAVYGAPVERDGVTVIPVASVRLGFGAGNDVKQEKQGGGGGAAISPIGYIEIRGGEAVFRRIRNPETQMLMLAPLLLAGGLTAGVVLRAMRGRRRADGSHRHRGRRQ